jgi:phosphate transport system substrate-binding protein
VMVDPETGLMIGDPSTGAGGEVTGAVVTALARPVGSGIAFGGLAAAELLAIILVPGLLAVRARRAAVTP